MLTDLLPDRGSGRPPFEGLPLVVLPDGPRLVSPTSAAPAAALGLRTRAQRRVDDDLARAAGLVAVAVLQAAAGLAGSDNLQPAAFPTGCHTAVLLCAAGAVGGTLAVLASAGPEDRLASPGQP